MSNIILGDKMKLKCIERMYKNGVVIGFLLENSKGEVKPYLYDVLLESLKDGTLDILNLKLTSDNKIRKSNNSTKDAIVITFKSVCRWIVCWLGLASDAIIYDTDFVGDCEFLHAVINSPDCNIDVYMEYKDRHGLLSLSVLNFDDMYLTYIINGGLDHSMERIKRKVSGFVHNVRDSIIIQNRN